MLGRFVSLSLFVVCLVVCLLDSDDVCLFAGARVSDDCLFVVCLVVVC